MVTSISTAASVVNVALARIGYKQFIGNLHDGSEAALVALTIYGQTRDDLQRDGNFDFPQRELVLALLKSAPASYVPGVTDWNPITNPQLNYKFEYAYPDDCLKLNSVRPQAIFIPNFDPRPFPFKIANDNYYTPPRRVILCNLQGAIGTYVGRVTDPSTWSVDFTESLIVALAERLAPALASLDAAKLEAVEARSTEAAAEMERG